MSIIVFIVSLAGLILVHEWGHFVMAKRTGMKIEEFGIGLPPRIFWFYKDSQTGKWRFFWGKISIPKKIKETVYSLNLLFLGGFVRIFGEEGKRDSPESFSSKSILARAGVMTAGAGMNLVLACFLFSIGFLVGFPTLIDGQSLPPQTQISETSLQILWVVPDSPAQLSNLKMGDRILAVDGKSFTQVPELQEYIKSQKGKKVIFTIQRGQDIKEIKVLARQNPPTDEGPVGIALGKVGLVRYAWWRVIFEGIRTTFNYLGVFAVSLFLLLKNLILSGRLIGEIAGPVGIASLTLHFSQLGAPYLLRFLGLLSVNLALINLLPLPALDGGRLIFLGLEKIRGQPVSERLEKAIHTAGFIILLILLALVTIRDILKI